MNNSKVLLLAVLGLVCFLSQGFSQTVTPHPVPREFGSKQYKVEVNGTPVPVFEANARVHFASFDFTGEVVVKVNGKIVRELGVPLPIRDEQLDGASIWEGAAVVRPLSRGVQVETDGSMATFTLTEPGQYSVEGRKISDSDTDNKDMVLFLFANKPEANRPKAGDPNVLYLEPGVHQQTVDLKSGQTLYLEAGAVLFGPIDIWEAKDVKILGRGVVFYYGPQSENHDDGYLHKKSWHPLTTHGSERLTVSGVTFVSRSRTWTIQMHTTFDASFDNVKLLGVNDQNINGDGFDWKDGGGRTRITNSLIRSSDDAFAFFTPRDSIPEPGGVVKDITIENCVIWPTRANIFRASSYGDNIVMRNCDIIHVPQSLFAVSRSILCSVKANDKQYAVISNFLFENLRFEESAAFLGIDWEKAKYRNITFRNISMPEKPRPSYVNSKSIDGVTFDNVRINGDLISGKKDLDFKVLTNEIEDLKFSK